MLHNPRRISLLGEVMLMALKNLLTVLSKKSIFFPNPIYMYLPTALCVYYLQVPMYVPVTQSNALISSTCTCMVIVDTFLCTKGKHWLTDKTSCLFQKSTMKFEKIKILMVWRSELDPKEWSCSNTCIGWRCHQV